ncbi:hypothetical protein [Ferrimonas marina]|uniref:Uncharacterized protein n=1 Tax=Ferrimonas marina TaxID=299255 RepID=A0A1M5YRY2_9GAMM|nr:hypothetical protein [Ferrimonas marina]SHI14363.1 hypothetical protein SAMN02745129_4307 [Ferrimonas marina]
MLKRAALSPLSLLTATLALVSAVELMPPSLVAPWLLVLLALTVQLGHGATGKRQVWRSVVGCLRSLDLARVGSGLLGVAGLCLLVWVSPTLVGLSSVLLVVLMLTTTLLLVVAACRWVQVKSRDYFSSVPLSGRAKATNQWQQQGYPALLMLVCGLLLLS